MVTVNAKILRRLRKEKGLTQAEMAERLNVSESTYGSYERGSCQPSIDILADLAQFHQVSIEYLLGLTDISLSFSHMTDLERSIVRELPSASSKKQDILLSFLNLNDSDD